MVLCSDRLKVEIAEPGIFPAVTSRFDWCGFITSIKLDDVHEFCASEPENLVHPSTGGIGLCNEYLCPSLCREAEVGEKFAKFGIGLFTKPDTEEYCFFRQYDIKPFPMRWEMDERSVDFYTDPDESVKDCVRQKKRIAVDGNELSMEVELENTGEREIQMEEFCHNFLTIDRLKIGPGYQLGIPYIQTEKRLEAGTFYGKRGKFSFSRYHPKAALLKIAEESINKESGVYEWKLEHKDSKAFVRCIDEFCPARVDIWSVDFIISVETFYRICLKPGDTTKWRRRWIFETVGGA